MIGWTHLTTNGRILAEPKLNRDRGLFVLGKVDEILCWERTIEQEKDSRFVDWVVTCVKCEPGILEAGKSGFV